MDCGGRLDDATRTCATVADLILLVCSPDTEVKMLGDAPFVERQGVDLHRVRLGTDKNPPLSETDIESNLGIRLPPPS